MIGVRKEHRLKCKHERGMSKMDAVLKILVYIYLGLMLLIGQAVVIKFVIQYLMQ